MAVRVIHEYLALQASADFVPEAGLTEAQIAEGLTTAELDELLPRLPDGQLTLANLSALYRHAQLSRALNLSVVDFGKLLDVTAENPFTAPETTVAVVSALPSSWRPGSANLSTVSCETRFGFTTSPIITPSSSSLGSFFAANCL